MGMDLDELRTFVMATRHGSFSGAARALSLSQPAVSRRIRSLEQEVGTELFDRSGSVVTPNRRGFAFLTFAEGVLRDYQLLQQTLSNQETIRGTLRIVASSTPGEYLLPDLIARWRHVYPELSATLHVADSTTVEECVEMGHCDLGFLGQEPRRGYLTRWPVAEDEIVLAVQHRHPFSSRTAVALEELEGLSFVERQAGSGTRALVEAVLTAHGEAMPVHRTVIELPNAQAQLSAINAGHGIGFVSHLALLTADHRRIVPVRLSGRPLRRRLYMVCDPRRCDPVRGDRTLLAVIQFVRETAPGLVAASTAAQ